MRPARWWARVEQTPLQLAIAFLAAVQAGFLLVDPLAPRGAWWLLSYVLLIVGGLAVVAGRLWDNRARVWPLHVESAGDALLAGVFLFLSSQAVSLAPNVYEQASALCGYGAITLGFLIRYRTVRRALGLLRKGL